MKRTNYYNFHFGSYNQIRETYKVSKKVDAICAKRSDLPADFEEQRKTFWDEFKAAARTFYNRPVNDPLSVPIRDGWRHSVSRDTESGYDYTIIPDEGQTDGEIAEYMYNSPVYLGSINSPYDCTGKHFTRWWQSTRTPSGIVLIHCWGIDI